MKQAFLEGYLSENEVLLELLLKILNDYLEQKLPEYQNLDILLCYRFIKKTEPNFNLLYFNARSSGKELELHIDCHLPFKGIKTNMMQFVILLEDSNIDNGCTKVVPGSHLTGCFSNRKTNKISSSNCWCKFI